MRRVASVVLAACLASLGCSEECNDIGCPASVVLALASPIDVTLPVTIEIDSDSRMVSCELSVEHNECDDLGVSTTMQQGQLTEVALFWSADQVGVRVAQDGTTLLDATATPVFTDEPNQPSGCAPTCRIGRAEL